MSLRMAPRSRSAAEHPAQLYRRLLDLITPPDDRVVDNTPVSTPDLMVDIADAKLYPSGFLSWCKHWRFKNRETGAILTFRNPWPGQLAFAEEMVEVATLAVERGTWEGIFALKAGKLGFTELECAWDGYVAWARRNSRVHLFSKEEDAAKEMLTYVKFGLGNLEPAWGLHWIDLARREIDADHQGSKTLRFIVYGLGEERDLLDERIVQAYATAKHPAIDKTSQHSHLDEWAHMEDPASVLGSISTTVAPGGTLHMVTRGAGENKLVEDIWAAADAGGSKYRGFFAPWTSRPDRDRAWLEAEASAHPTMASFSHYAAETAEDAFRGDEDNDFVPIEIWDRCFDPSIAFFIDDPSGPQIHDGHRGRWVGNLQPGDKTTLVLAADAGVSHDWFAIVAGSRHPTRPDDPAVRMVKSWKPEEFEDEVIDFATVESWIRTVCEGGCRFGHPLYAPWHGGGFCRPLKGQAWSPGECPACRAIDEDNQHRPQVERFNVYELCYDPYQLAAMAQSLRRDGVTYVKEFPQAGPRLEADRKLYDMIVGNRLAHPGDYRLREHVLNAKSKTQKDEESKLRIVKKAAHRKVDLLVAASMCVAEVLRLNL